MRDWTEELLMKLQELLAQIDAGILVLPQFQRGFVWKRRQVHDLMESLYKSYPIGSLLVWNTKANIQDIKGGANPSIGNHELLLDGQQRLTTLYGIVRGKRPAFSDADEGAFLNLYFNVETEEFEFYRSTKMQHNPHWVSVTHVMQNDLGSVITPFISGPNLAEYFNRLNRITSIKERVFHIETMTDQDKPMDEVVEIFDLVNSGGTKLSKGDLALAKICADWPQARETMQDCLKTLAKSSYHFNLDWLLRCINALETGHADFSELERQNVTVEQIQDGLARAVSHIHNILNHLASRLGLDHGYVLGSPNSLIALARYFDKHGKFHAQGTVNRLCYWYVHAMLWQRYSGQVETRIRQDIVAVEDSENPVDGLIERLRENRWPLNIEARDLTAANRGGRFYSLLYMLTRVYGARDLCKGIELKKYLLGSGNQLELHHLFPKHQLRKHGGFGHNEVNAIANFAFLTADCNKTISARLPKDYFPEYEEKHPGVLASHWIPMDEHLWKIENFRDFLAARRELLAKAANAFLEQLREGKMAQPQTARSVFDRPAGYRPVDIASIASDEEAVELRRAMDWMGENNLPRGEFGYELLDANDELIVTLDLAWPEGIQIGMSHPVALLIDEEHETLRIAQQHEFICFTALEQLQRYVRREILAE
ncbi:MAG: DUF262 domain-containing protein [Chloroflexi bacterium]|nr:DUF262 domain-containing protein [Chloroflexota bacterium]